MSPSIWDLTTPPEPAASPPVSDSGGYRGGGDQVDGSAGSKAGSKAGPYLQPWQAGLLVACVVGGVVLIVAVAGLVLWRRCGPPNAPVAQAAAGGSASVSAEAVASVAVAAAAAARGEEEDKGDDEEENFATKRDPSSASMTSSVEGGSVRKVCMERAASTSGARQQAAAGAGCVAQPYSDAAYLNIYLPRDRSCMWMACAPQGAFVPTYVLSQS
jgi:hypothetical protein